MNLKMNNEQLEKMLAKYYREELDFDGKAKLEATKKYTIQDDYTYKPTATIMGKMQLAGETYNLEQEIDEKEIIDIINFYFEKEDYKIGDINFSITHDGYNGPMKCNGITIDITKKNKVKRKGEI